MARGNRGNLVLNIRLDSKQRAFQEALLVPWRQLADSAASRVEWHIFILWVRVIAESAGELPAIVRLELQRRCPGFLNCQSGGQTDSNWKSLDEWVTFHHFAEAKAGGWLNAVMYYAYKDLRTEQAWSLWERTEAAWRQKRPPRWPSLAEWTARVLATRTLVQQGTNKARAVEAMARVDVHRLHKAVWDLLEWRAFALWVDCVSKPEQALDDLALMELRRRCPGVLTASSSPLWLQSLFLRIVHAGESKWFVTARSGGWYAALRYYLVYHPRYQRLVHYQQHCHDEWPCLRRITYPSFADWLAAADAYHI